jgi:hypothetical protein
MSDDELVGVSYNVRNTSLESPGSRKGGGHGNASLEGLEMFRCINCLISEYSSEHVDRARANTHRYSRYG